MRSTAVFGTLMILIMVFSTVPYIGSSVEDIEPGSTRADEEEYTLRSDTMFYPGEARTREFRDLDGDGKLDALIISRERDGPDVHYYLFIFSLDDGRLLYDHTFNLTGGAYFSFVEVDDDPLPELLIRESDHNPLKARLFILDTNPFHVIFDSGYHAGYINGWIINDELFVQRTNKVYSYVPDSDIWFAAYSISNWSMVWRTMRFPRASSAYVDLDGDGIQEFIFHATWASPPPGKAHIYFIDLDAHQVTLNSTDMEFMSYSGGGRSAFDFHDIDGDGKYEIVAVARWSTNNTCKAFLYSASVNESLWVTRSLGDYTLKSNIDWVDIDGDGVDEISMILSDPSDDKISKLVILDPLTGDVLLESQMNDNFHSSNIFYIDVNGDGNLDVFFYNYTAWNDGEIRFKLVEPSMGWTMTYDVKVPDMRSFNIMDIDDDDVPEILITGKGSIPGDDLIDLRRYDPADMSEIFSLGDFDLGPDGSYYTTQIYMGMHRELSVITVNYKAPSGGNYSQLHIMNASTGVHEYSSPRFHGNLMTKINFETHFFNNDRIEDIIFAAEWENTGDHHNWKNMTIVDCETFDVLWKSDNYARVYDWKTNNASFQKWGSKRDVQIRYSDGSQDLFDHFLFDLSGEIPEPIYEITDNVYHDLSGVDRYLDGNFVLEDISSRSGVLNVSFFNVGIGMTPKYLMSMELQGEYANSQVLDAAGDGDVIWRYRTGSNPDRVYYIDPSDLSIINVVLIDNHYNQHYTMDVDKNGIKEDFWLVWHNLGSTGYSNTTVIDQETGEVIQQLLEVDYSISPHIMDIDGDRRDELIFVKEHYWEEPYDFGLSVYNVSTDLPPDELAPIEEVQMVEDGPSVTIDLDDHFSDEEDPLAFSLEDPDDVVDWSILTTTNELELTPSPDANGLHPLVLHVMDAYWDIEYKFMVNITPVNDAPVLLNVSGISDIWNFSVPVMQEEENRIEVNVYDADGDELEYWLEMDHERISINSTSGIISFTPETEDGPHTDISVNVSDGMEMISFNFTTMNENVPHAPVNVEITSPANGTSSYGTWTFTGTADDPDLLWGDELTFTWSSIVDGYLGEGEEIVVTGLTPGEHLISLDVMDSEGLTAFDIIVIEVLPFVAFENLTDIEPTADLSLVMDMFTVDAHFEKINGTTFATYDVFMKGTGGPDLEKLLLYISVPVDDEYIPFDPMNEGQAEGTINGTMWEYSRIYTISLPGSDHTEEDLRTILFEMAVLGWNSDGLFDTANRSAEMSYSFEGFTAADDDDDDTSDDDDTTDDDDDTSDDDDDSDSKGSGIAIGLVLIFIILLLLGIIAGILVSRSRGKGDEMGWGEE